MCSSPNPFLIGDASGQVWIQEFARHGRYPMADDASEDGFRSLLLAGRVVGVSNVDVDTAPPCFDARMLFDIQFQKSTGAFFCAPEHQSTCEASLDTLEQWVQGLADYEHGMPQLSFVHPKPAHRPTMYQFQCDPVFFSEPIPHSELIAVQKQDEESVYCPAYIKEPKFFDAFGEPLSYCDLDGFFVTRRDVVVQVVPYIERVGPLQYVRLMLIALWCVDSEDSHMFVDL